MQINKGVQSRSQGCTDSDNVAPGIKVIGCFS